ANGTNPTAGPSTGGGMGGGGRPGGSAGGESPATGTPPSGGAPGGTQPGTGSGTGSASGETSGTGSASGETSDEASGAEPGGGGTDGAGAGAGGGGGGTQISTATVAYLKKHQDGATWLVAVATDQTAAQLILESGQPVISMGGWSGSDEAMTLAKLKSLVAAGRLHYVMVSGSGGQGTAAEISAWVTEHGTAVASADGLYRLDASDVG
ncbi:hypothetical protein GA0115242_12661, partial [Streptomyces sp. SolWspMP-5a-2]